MSDPPPSPATLLVRVATADDWPSIWPIVRAVIGAGDTYAFPPDMAEDAARAAWLLDGRDRHVTFVAEHDGVVIGTAILRPNLPGLGDHVANAAWMVDPAHAGRGYGRRFAEAVIEMARLAGFTAMQFNAVVATNTRAIALWESLGFRTIGTVPGGFRQSRSGPTDLRIMFREL